MSSIFHVNKIMLTAGLRRYCRLGPAGPVVSKWSDSNMLKVEPRGFIDQKRKAKHDFILVLAASEKS